MIKFAAFSSVGLILFSSAANAVPAWETSKHWTCRGDTVAQCQRGKVCLNDRSGLIHMIDFDKMTLTNFSYPDEPSSIISTHFIEGYVSKIDVPSFPSNGMSYVTTAGGQTLGISDKAKTNVTDLTSWYEGIGTTIYSGSVGIHFQTCRPMTK